MAEERRHISQLNLLSNPAPDDELLAQDKSEGTGAGADAYKRLPLSAVGILSLAQTWAAVQTFPNFKTGQIVLSPNTATTVTPLNTTLCLFVLYPLTGGGGGYNAIVAFRADGNASITSSMLIGANAATTTGVLNGTTGDSNTVTISPHTDGLLYIENRRTLSMTWNYAMFSA